MWGSRLLGKYIDHYFTTYLFEPHDLEDCPGTVGTCPLVFPGTSCDGVI